MGGIRKALMKEDSQQTPRADRYLRRVQAQKTWVAKPRVGDKLGSFRLMELLGEGGAGAVFRGEHTFLKRAVAIKVLHPELYLDSAMVARFFQEALAVNRARHRNLIDITDVVAGESFPPYIVMELLDGEDLGDYIDEHAPLPLSWVYAVVMQICDALATVHGLGIVHRDMKPENIFLMDKGEDIPTVKLLDFGIAKFLDTEDNRRRTWSGSVLGTPAYMPLEQIHGIQVDHRADIYALGVVIYEMLTGRLPFDMESVDELVESLSALEPPPPSERPLVPAPEPIPLAVDRLVLRCLHVDPSRRFQSAADLAAAFSEAMASSKGRPVTPLGRPPRRASKGVAPLAGASVGALQGAHVEGDSSGAEPLAGPGGAEEAPSGQRARTGQKAHPWRWLGWAAGLVAVAGLLLAGWMAYRASLGDARSPAAQRVGAASAGAGVGGAGAGMSRPRAGGVMTPGSPRETRFLLLSTPPAARVLHFRTRVELGVTPVSVVVRAGEPGKYLLTLPGHREAMVVVRQGDPNPVRVELFALAPRRSGGSPGMVAQPPPGRRRAVRLSEVPAPPAMRPLARVVRERPSGAAMGTSPPRPMQRVSDQGIVNPFRE